MGYEHNDIAIMGNLRAALSEEGEMFERNDIVTVYRMDEAIAEAGGGGGSELLSQMTAVGLDSTVTSISSETFKNCTSLSGVYCDSSITVAVGDSAFEGCTSLEQLYYINLGDIGANAFKGCVLLSTANIASTASSIGDNAFAGCSTLSIIYIAATTPPVAGSEIFGPTSSLASGFMIYTPNASAESAYKSAAGWSMYSDYISWQ